MKRLGFWLLAALLCLPCLALAETTFDGTVVAGETVSVVAPFGGTISSLSLRAGGRLTEGDEIAAIETTKVYATADGTVTGVFGEAGDSVDSVVSRYGAVLYVEPTSRYSITADIEKAYNSSEMKYVNIGERVAIRSTDGDYTATGTITAADGTSYTVETDSGELLMQDTVYVYRSSDYTSTSRIGRGTVSRTAELAVGGSGSILRFHVKDGDAVKRGDLLLETVTGTFDGLYATSNEIVAETSGIIASVNVSAGATVNKGDTLLTLYPVDKLQIEMTVDEYDLAAIAEGDPVRIHFNWDETGGNTLEGKVAMISHVNMESTTSGAEATYAAYVTFTPPENVRLGMTVVVSTIDATTDKAAEGVTQTAADEAEAPVDEQEAAAEAPVEPLADMPSRERPASQETEQP